MICVYLLNIVLNDISDYTMINVSSFIIVSLMWLSLSMKGLAEASALTHDTEGLLVLSNRLAYCACQQEIQ